MQKAGNLLEKKGRLKHVITGAYNRYPSLWNEADNKKQSEFKYVQDTTTDVYNDFFSHSRVLTVLNYSTA